MCYRRVKDVKQPVLILQSPEIYIWNRLVSWSHGQCLHRACAQKRDSCLNSVLCWRHLEILNNFIFEFVFCKSSLMRQCRMHWVLGVVAHEWSHLLPLSISLHRPSTSTDGAWVQVQEVSRFNTYTCMMSHRVRPGGVNLGFSGCEETSL